VTDSVLDLMKFVLLGLLYVFFARVLWAVWSEVRTPSVAESARSAPGSSAAAGPGAQPVAAARSGSATTRAATAPMGRSSTGSAHAVATTLVIITPDHLTGRSLPIGDEITIGRRDGCTVSVADDSFLSTNHARVFILDDQPMVEDLESTNGSFHNGARFGGIRLISPGDLLTFGSITAEVR
jgi:hypothetical protein